MSRWTSLLLVMLSTIAVYGVDKWDVKEEVTTAADSPVPPPPTELEELSSGSALHDIFYLNTAWDANTEPDLAGYRIYKSRVSGKYDDVTPIDVGKTPMGLTDACLFLGDYDPFKPECCEYRVDGFTEGTWYLVATAYDDADPPNESDYSEEIVHYFHKHIPMIASPHSMRAIEK